MTGCQTFSNQFFITSAIAKQNQFSIIASKKKIHKSKVAQHCERLKNFGHINEHQKAPILLFQT